MNPFNATVQGGYEARDGKFVHWVKPDKGVAVQIRGDAVLPEGKRVRLVGLRIEEVQ